MVDPPPVGSEKEVVRKCGAHRENYKLKKKKLVGNTVRKGPLRRELQLEE
jgi:hypothetical protein